MIAFLLVLAFSMGACTVRQAEEETTAVTTEAETTEETTKLQQTEKNEDTSAADPSADSTAAGEKRITEEEALAAAKAYLGDTDPDTGYKYSFVSQGTMQDTETGEEFYKIRVSWYLPEDDRYSVCGYLLVTLDGKTVSKFDW